MPRIVAIDYGKKRTGIAVTDELQIIATGLCTIDTKEIIPFLKKYLSENNVEKVIVGMPKDLQNRSTDGTPYVITFIDVFSKTFPEIPLQKVDERFSSKMASQSMIDSGMKKINRRNKAIVDEIAATIILQSYMQNL